MSGLTAAEGPVAVVHAKHRPEHRLLLRVRAPLVRAAWPTAHRHRIVPMCWSGQLKGFVEGTEVPAQQMADTTRGTKDTE